MNQNASAPVVLFISYAREDVAFLKELETYLTQLQKQGTISIVHQGKIEVGSRRREVLDRALNNAVLILLLMSADYRANAECEQEMQHALARSQAGEAIVIPILLRATPLLHEAPLADLQYLPRDKQPVAHALNRDKVWNEIVEEICETLKGAGQRQSPVAASSQTENGQHTPRIDWGNAPEVSNFFGRSKELDTLQQWILVENYRLIAIVGMKGGGKTWLSVKLGQGDENQTEPMMKLGKGGIGKTDLSLKLAHGICQQFDYVIWQRLLNAPSLTEVLTNLVSFLSDQREIMLPKGIDEQIEHLLHYLQKHRCLLIFDNAETILEGGKQATQYREGYEGYGQLFRQIGEVAHQSCLLLTSRETPQDIAQMEGGIHPVRSLKLGGLDYKDGKKIFAAFGKFRGSSEDWQRLIQFYNGNPLALELAARHIQKVFSGSITAFLDGREQIFSDLRGLLDWHFQRLAPSEKELMYWLAINREPKSLIELKEDIISQKAKAQISSTLDLLQRSIPLEKTGNGFSLQPVLMEYMVERLVEGVLAEMTHQQFQLLNTYALMKAVTKDYVRESQARLILHPLLQSLLTMYGENDREQQLKHLLTVLHTITLPPGYAAGNILNCLLQINADLAGTDFSSLPVWQAYLREARLVDVNFTHADLSRSTFTDMFGSILSVAFSPDGTIVAAGTDAGEIRLWRVSDGMLFATFSGHTDWIWGLTFSPDGTYLASGSSDRTIRVWHVANEQCIHILRGHRHRIRGISFSADNTRLASSSEDHEIRIWNVVDGVLLHTLSGHTNPVRAVAFTPDGKTLISGSDDHTVRIWAIEEERCIHVLTGHSSQIWSLALSPDGRTIASGGDDRSIRIWDLATGTNLKVLSGHTNWICSLAFGPDNRHLVSGSADGTVRVWDVVEGHLLQTLLGHKNWVNSVSFAPTGKTLASGSHDQTVRIWETNTGHCLMTLHGYSTSIRSVAFSPQKNVLASGERIVHLWDVKSGQSLATLSGHSPWIRALAFSSDSTLLASGSDDQTIRIWKVHTAQHIYTLTGHTNRVKSIAFSPDNLLLVSGSDDQTVCLWDMRFGRRIRCLRGHTNRIRSVAFNPDGKTFASGSDDRTVRVWNTETEQPVHILQDHTNRVWSIAFSPDGRFLATGSEDTTARVWDVATGKCLSILEGHTNPIWAIAFSPNGEMLASSSEDHTVRIWQVSSGRCQHVLEGHSQPIWAVTFSPDSTMLASGSHDSTVRLWDSASGANLAILRGHTAPIWTLSFSSDCTLLASGSDDGTCHLWEVLQRRCRYVLKSELPYERMNITSIKGLAEPQKAVLRALGAIENVKEIVSAEN
ncbi:MAG TPA: TIR domain-containing protein [Ktedonobacteraceae bacterium]|jgi:WD40 repeat protein|nr:TIR domain-containing protein [Ktedonobacteraceae bacterium]